MILQRYWGNSDRRLISSYTMNGADDRPFTFTVESLVRTAFPSRTLEKLSLWVKGKLTTTYVASGWIAVQRFFRNKGWGKIGLSSNGNRRKDKTKNISFYRHLGQQRGSISCCARGIIPVVSTGHSGFPAESLFQTESLNNGVLTLSLNY